MVRGLVTSFIALLIVVTRPANAHPLHSSHTAITRERGGELKISIRLFADDFAATLQSLQTSSKGATLDAVAQLYLARTVAIVVNGKPLPLVWCGMRSDQSLTWVCARTSKPVDGSFSLRNSMMFDRFRDQLNIISWTGRKDTRTTILSARVREVRLD